MPANGTQGSAALAVCPIAWKTRPGDVQRAVEEIAAILNVPAPTVEDGTAEFPVTAKECDRAFLLWRECRGQDVLHQPQRQPVAQS